ncbi:resolvase domain-containing protein [Caballeronia catudaia]|uniref:Resolvase domain-containing protein n=1 Tax=Caballeronia catudaia TaxID=1777136 RepID=A0A158DR89_9BURK|nr:recombinase family protein [Caballeronia catudaia]SAK97098.1 resolvase domain-containing protein [Caballeronia catudaia]
MSKHQRVGYKRVSTVDQNTGRQLDGIELDRVFEDKASGKDTHRPALQEAIKYVRDGDTLVVHSMDRLARNTEDLLRLVRELNAKHVSVEFVKERLTFSGSAADPMAELMMTMLAGFAQFERSMIRERQREGIAVAKEKGVYKGGKAKLTAEQVASMRARVAAGDAKAVVARDFGISRETLYQYLKAALQNG